MDTLNNSPKIYNLGKYQITHQSFIIFILGCFITFIIGLSGFYTLFKNKSSGTTKIGILVSIFIVSALIFAYTCFVTYVTNCLSVGKCNFLAWIYVVVAIMYTIGFILTSKLF